MATTDDRERLDAIANAILAPHVARQQHASERLQSKRPGSRRWFRIAAILTILPYLANVVLELIPEGRMSPFHWVLLAGIAVGAFVVFRRKE